MDEIMPRLNFFPRGSFFDPTRMGIELIYLLIVIAICLFIYFKTKDMYDLTKHKGIGYFRNAFLLFASAYIFRFAFFLFGNVSRLVFDFSLPRQFMGPISLLFIGYLSTLAIFFLTMSTIWKRFKHKHVDHLLHAIALFISLVVFFLHSPVILTITQFILLVFAIVMSYLNSKRSKSKKHPHMFLVYVLLFLFWIINLSLLGPKHIHRVGFKTPVYVISIIIFVIIFFKVKRWTK